MKKQPKVVQTLDSDYKLVLNVGANDGVKSNDKFLIYALSDHEVIDPDTKESLGFLELVKGTGKVVHLQDKLCTIESISFKNPAPIKTIAKKPANTLVATLGSFTVEETTIKGNPERLPFDSPEEGDLAKLL